MRKWMWALALVVGVALAAPVMAIDWSASGWIGSSWANYRNIPTTYDDLKNDRFWSRARVKFTARASENLYGVMYFEMDSANWGETGESKDKDTGLVKRTGRNHIGAWGADQVAVEVKNCFVDFRIPGIELPVWARVGIQPFVIRPVVLLYADGAGVTVRSKVQNVTLAAGWAKAVDSNTATASDDTDAYFFMASGKVGTFSVGGYWLFVNGNDFDDSGNKTGEPELHWIGAFADGKVNNVNLTLDFIYNFGDDDYGDIDYSGYYFRGVASYLYDKFEFGLGGHYASELDETDTDDYKGFKYPKKSEAFAINNDSVIFGGWFIGFSNMGDLSALAPNFDMTWPLDTWGVRGFVHYQAYDWLKLGAQIAYWGDNVENGDKFGEDVKDDDEIGWEFDIGAKVKLYKNLTWGLAFGYLAAGDALDQDGGIDDPYAIVSSLVYTF